MASSTNNVKLGVCSILYKGVDLGYTKGGVDVDVTTDTHQTMVDQFGDSIVNEWITKRNIKVTCPLAETTLDNLIAIMPGSTMKSNGTAATGIITIATLPVTGDTIIVTAAKNGSLQEAFGAGTAATIASIAKIGYRDEILELPPVETHTISIKIRTYLDDLKAGKVEDAFGWCLKV